MIITLRMIVLAAAEAGSEKYVIPLLQSIGTSILTGFVFYVWQRKHKINDSLTMERNKSSVQKSMQFEEEIFDLMKTIKGHIDFSSDDMLALSGSISTMRNERQLHISDKISEISGMFADYLLEAASDPSKRNRFEEERLFKKFKKAFKK